MKTVNALKVRNNFGEILDMLIKTGEPVLISKGNKLQAVLITLDQFQKRFLDYQAEEKKRALLDAICGLQDQRIGEKESLKVLRELRGYPS